MSSSFIAQGIPTPANGTSREGPPDARCRWESRDPKPTVVNVFVRRNDGSNFRLYSQASQGALGDRDNEGFLRVRYGHEAVQRVVDLDLRSATFQVPPGTFVELEARRFNEVAAGAGSVVIDIAATIVPGVLGGDVLMPTSSVLWQPSAPGTADGQIAVPQSARFWQLYANEPLPADVVVNAGGAGLAGAPFYIDLNVPTQFPSHPLWHVTGFANMVLNFQGADVATTGFTAEFYCQL